VAPRCGDKNGALRFDLTPDIPHVRAETRRNRLFRGVHGNFGGFSLQHTGEGDQRMGANDFNAPHDRRLFPISRGDEKTFRTQLPSQHGNRKNAPDGTKLTIQRQFREKDRILQRISRELTTRHENAHGNREVIA